MTAFPALVACTLAQRETKGSRLCACGTIVYGERGRLAIPDQCATCAMRAGIEAEAAWDAMAVAFVAKFSSVERSP